MKKQAVSENSHVCKVTFELPAEVNARTAALCGEFNGWSTESHPMARNDDGSFVVSVSLQPGQSYRFRYLLDGERWENDWTADAYVPNSFGSDDSVVQL